MSEDSQYQDFSSYIDEISVLRDNVFSLDHLRKKWSESGPDNLIFAKRIARDINQIINQLSSKKSEIGDEYTLEILYLMSTLIDQIKNLSVIENNTSNDNQEITYQLMRISDYATNINFHLIIRKAHDYYAGKAMENESQAINHLKSLQVKESEAEVMLKNMKLVEQAMLREGLTKSFKETVGDLGRRIRNFDTLNYVSLLLIFSSTVILFLNFDIFKDFKPQNISVYERFILILPFIFLSWFASKRSQFLYQIKEEYSYKYATALAYEGYKNEVKDDAEMMKKLMGVTIDNLARSPLEQFDKNSDHAPYNQFIKEFRK